jgi:chromatin remodeling complex protein RSC6
MSNKSLSRSVSQSTEEKNTKKSVKSNKTEKTLPKVEEETPVVKSVKEEKPKQETPAVTKPAKEEKPKTEKKPDTKKKTVKAPKTEATPEPKTTPKEEKEEVVEEDDHTEEEKESKKRREVTYSTVESEFDSLMDLLREQIETSRSTTDKKKSCNVKLLRQLGKRLKVLKADCLKISKQRRTNRQKNTSSGFMKPVQVSTDMAKFAGWDPVQLRSRIDATKYICQYIRDNNLQNPSDRRQINPDDKLTKLLGYDTKKDKPLTYYSIQQKIQQHFKNPDC